MVSIRIGSVVWPLTGMIRSLTRLVEANVIVVDSARSPKPRFTGITFAAFARARRGSPSGWPTSRGRFERAELSRQTGEQDRREADVAAEVDNIRARRGQSLEQLAHVRLEVRPHGVEVVVIGGKHIGFPSIRISRSIASPVSGTSGPTGRPAE